METENEQKITQLQSFKDGLENLSCVLSQCLPDGNWRLFEENSQLTKLWHQFCEEIYKGNGKQAIVHANLILQIIGPTAIAINFHAAIKSSDSLQFEESRFLINRDAWEEFRKSMNSDDVKKIVNALSSYLERALTYLKPTEQSNANNS